MKAYAWMAAMLMVGTVSAQAASKTVALNLAGPEGTLQGVGEVKVEETPYGLLFTPDLKGLPAGVHGFHVHQNGSCAPAMKDGKMSPAEAAGGHMDPAKTGKHLGPYADGHLGDLPAIYVNADGTATYPVLAPRLKTLAEVEGHALMIHAGGDNHADMPQPLGGGGARVACGVL
ncbi:superoxide dismutase [Cu-Zn] SodC [Pseudomonas sp. RIT-PI-S]|uniref:superoxide dismutase [Cu-Zn] SodC n=1 Tax=Pseudomonas sp. RIT-PI-S TaxID=3035295 RepID=UPI0021DB26FD|nr:superoxide dismutase [Cu-Zn] SodC [Pseudomonas sp. RIT-PI-S]